MGNLFTRTAKLPKAALLVSLVVLSGTLLAGFHSSDVSAAVSYPTPTGNGTTGFVVKLKMETSAQVASDYKVTAKRAVTPSGSSVANPQNLSYFGPGKFIASESSPTFVTTPFTYGASPASCSASASTSGLNKWTFTVLTSTGAVATTQPEDYCGFSDSQVIGQFVLVTISVPAVANTPAHFTGNVSYVAPDGTSQPYRSTTVANLTPASGTPIGVPIDDKGNFDLSNIAIGTYTFSGVYDVTDTSHQELQGTSYKFSQSVTLVSGDNVLNVTGTTGGTPSTTTGSTAAANDTALDCGSGSFNWLVCPVIQLATNAAQYLDNFITSQLDIDVRPIFDNTTVKGSESNGYYTAWNSFRVIATALLVVGGLIMVASQALGLEFLDAYTIRKTLPRLLIAIIGISLSWPLMRFFVNLFDILGFDVRTLIYTPFSTFTGSIGVATGIFSTVGVLAGFLILGPVALTFILTAMIALFAGFLALVIREIAIVMLIILAPVAIACYILPNTQRIWHLWSENFFGLLLAFPLIAAMIAAGNVFAAVALSTKGGGGAASLTTHAFGLVSHITGHGFSTHTVTMVASTLQDKTTDGVAIVAKTAPPLLIGKVITMTTGAISTLAGGAGGFLNGAKKKLSEARGNKAKRSMHEFKTGSRFNPNSKLTKYLGGNIANRVGANAGAGFKGRYGFGKTGAAARANNATLTADGAARESQAFAAQMNNEGTMAALAFGNDASKLRKLKHYQNANGIVDAEGEARLQTDMAAARSIGVTRRMQVAGAEALAKSGKVIGDRTEAESLYEEVGGGNSALKNAVKGNYQFTSRQVGRADIGRNSAHESMRELDMSAVSRLKPKAVEQLFGTDREGHSQFHDAVASASSPEEKQHFYDVLYAAQQNPYTTPEQQGSLARTIATVSGHDEWGNAKENYGAKMRAGGQNDPRQLPGQPGEGGNPAGPPPPQ